MKLEALLLVCGCAFVVQSRRRSAVNNKENEVLEKGDVMVRFPSYSYEVPKETLGKKSGMKKRFGARTVPTSVEPMEGTSETE